MRPAHIHAIVTTSGFQRLVAPIFVEGAPYLETDATFGAKPLLMVHLVPVEDALRAPEPGFPNSRFYQVEFDFVWVEEEACN